MYHIAICDDDSTYAQYLEKMIRRSEAYDEQTVIRHYKDGGQLLAESEAKYDLVFMDMQYGSMDGYKVALQLRKRQQDFVLAFCTGVQIPRAEHFTARPFRYLIKNDGERTPEYVRDLLEEMKCHKKTDHIFLQQKGESYRLNADEVLYIERAKRGSSIHLTRQGNEATDQIYSSMRLQELYEQLKESGFEYPHNSYIVNLRMVIAISRDKIMLANREELNISRSRSEYFKKRFSEVLSVR